MRKLPKSVNKTIRYIKYDAPEDKLDALEREINKAIERRKQGRESEPNDRSFQNAFNAVDCD
ncbi:hypothetical protein LCM20_10105 [Halobacillus litoralis]|uniref:hypothetical protein n=1 Tax=Halobacillus litoralis TaxID=45668 RepID=UPI001CD77011|nr:hypothetical protein [Halobacillus litoralis]MCA0970943.1 hypothetical protein [Halobacillus litoralis]